MTESDSESEPEAEEELENVLDLRRVPPPQRHSLIFDEFEELERGEELILLTSSPP
ncbi:MAG: DUF2249 domain-containing protein [Halobacteria archaeon]|nr:DUF2249 domain-containing protein [Halobacteria archaeon]